MGHQSVGILVIGNEILSGRTHELNAHLAAKMLFDRGSRLEEIIVVPDIPTRISSAIGVLRRSYDAAITSGGIGPTHDDITMQAIADACGVPLHEHPEIIRVMSRRFGSENLNAARRKMANVPLGSELIHCKRTPSPGVRIDNIYVLAGVPEIFADQMEAIITDFGDRPRFRREIDVTLPESLFAEPLSNIQVRHPGIEIGSYPGSCKPPFSGRICLSGTDSEGLDAALADVRAMVNKLNKR